MENEPGSSVQFDTTAETKNPINDDSGEKPSTTTTQPVFKDLSDFLKDCCKNDGKPQNFYVVSIGDLLKEAERIRREISGQCIEINEEIAKMKNLMTDHYSEGETYTRSVNYFSMEQSYYFEDTYCCENFKERFFS
ncbi:Hypothetical protein CINCED_3A019737 [Cinara cedri]|uniref:Uncharacterized protein n=1 Tax=Cinara cedri TaxID=506608 RepID=A0A5E4LZ14_9HEMI|nr:Hypothetical protein CINCED_3A019737 [Cinara cedri]